MNYNLNQLSKEKQVSSNYKALKELFSVVSHEKKNLYFALFAIVLNSTFNLLGPFLIGYAVDVYVQNKQYHGLFLFCGLLLILYLLAFGTAYLQTKIMGSVGQRMLFTLRNNIFNKLQQLPLAFFNVNKAGDLISRVNNDTDKLNTFFSQSLMQFIGSIATMLGAGIFLLLINIKLGIATLLPALFILIFTKLVSPWVKKKNAASLTNVGNLSAEIQESLNNFKVIVAFNRSDYFKKRFDASNQHNYQAALGAGFANNIFLPIYGLFSSLAQLIVLIYGIYLINQGDFTIGFLVSYLAYATYFYNPLRQLAALWASFQMAMAGWDRISLILNLKNDLDRVEENISQVTTNTLIEFQQVHFAYPNGKEILHHVSFKMEAGKTYALVGPTGGGKSTTASLLARLYDPTAGKVLLDGRDIRSYTAEERTQKIGFILQEPFLFTGTVKDNILYGNESYKDYSKEQLIEVITDAKLESLLTVFENGLETKVTANSDNISLGQKQLIAFMRAVLRNPDVLILDEATANIDTVTEKLLEEILNKLPLQTTKIVIAHRLNTIQNADEIFFVNAGEVIRAGSFQDALNKLMKDQRVS